MTCYGDFNRVRLLRAHNDAYAEDEVNEPFEVFSQQSDRFAHVSFSSMLGDQLRFHDVAACDKRGP